MTVFGAQPHPPKNSHGSTPSEAGAGVFILADTPKIAKSETGVGN